MSRRARTGGSGGKDGGRGHAAPPAGVSGARARAPRAGSGGATHAVAVAPLRRTHFFVAALVAAACVLIGVTHWIYETDVWEHLLVGRVFWTQHRVFTTDVWSWPAYGAPNVNPSWGFSALLWPFWAIGGVLGLEAWRWLTALATFALLALAARRLGARGLATFFVIALGALVYRQRMQIRPETLAGVWFALTVFVLERARRDDLPQRAWALVPIALVWANSHISFFLLFVLLGFHLLDAAVARRTATWRTLALVAIAALAVTLIGPFGAGTLAQPFLYLFEQRGEPFFAAISELKPIVWSQNWSNGLPLLLAGWPALLIARALRRRIDRVEWLTAIVFTALAFSSARFVATYVLAATPFLARDLDEVAAARPLPRALAGPWTRTTLVAAACILVSLYDWTHGLAPLGFRLDESRMPIAACDWIAAHGVRGRAMNHFQLGGYLLWRFWPERDRLPFLDIHADGPRALRDDYQRAMSEPAGWGELDAKYRFDWALLSRRYADRRGLLDTIDEDERWSLVFVDDVAVLYLRRAGATAPLAERFAYHTLGGSRATITARVAAASRDTTLRREMLRELARQARESQANFYGRAMARALAGE